MIFWRNDARHNEKKQQISFYLSIEWVGEERERERARKKKTEIVGERKRQKKEEGEAKIKEERILKTSSTTIKRHFGLTVAKVKRSENKEKVDARGTIDFYYLFNLISHFSIVYQVEYMDHMDFEAIVIIPGSDACKNYIQEKRRS